MLTIRRKKDGIILVLVSLEVHIMHLYKQVGTYLFLEIIANENHITTHFYYNLLILTFLRENTLLVLTSATEKKQSAK